jgi:hypothetical protein
MTSRTDRLKKAIRNIELHLKSMNDLSKRYEDGEELCNHHFNNQENCYEVYCSGCDTHIGENYDEFAIPFKTDVDAYCYECQKSPKEKTEERLRAEEFKLFCDLKKLAELKSKYPQA